ncbi:MAG TPA: hypothetical protein VHF89_02705 [Solirubrobacteraceae bacterium]|nr:hypothetical protein [Solirubrobacteraceae bacterium]
MLTIALIALLALVPTWIVLRRALRRRADAERWRVVTRTLEDGSRRVVLSGPGGERVVRELPAALDGPALEDELAEARSRAFAEAMRLNQPLAAPGPAPRTRS